MSGGGVMIPRPGLALIQRCLVAETVPGGKIILTENTRDFIATQQAELVAIGTEADAEDYTWEPEDNAWDELQGLGPGRWLLLKSRTWVPTDDPNLFLVRHEDIEAVLD